ncbi:hypothetical protein [Colwellia sp. MB3u-70]|nr:hypothetical protein [Colwellia sp. MB3u-70]
MSIFIAMLDHITTVPRGLYHLISGVKKPEHFIASGLFVYLYYPL